MVVWGVWNPAEKVEHTVWVRAECCKSKSARTPIWVVREAKGRVRLEGNERLEGIRAL